MCKGIKVLATLCMFIGLLGFQIQCGGGSGGGSSVPPLAAAPTITSFTANPTVITAGKSSTLSWAVTGATSLSIDQGVGTVTGTSTTVSPTTTITYTLTATNGAGSNTATATVTVTAASGLGIITSFTANPATITVGQSSTLSWVVTGVISLSIDQGVGTVTGTSTTVSPTVTTTYTLTAINGSGSNTASVTVTVAPLGSPTITSFVANPTSITVGQSSTLSWIVSGATSLSINQGVGTVTGTSTSVTPTATITYTLTATNTSGSNISTTTVTVTPAPGAPTITSFTANPNSISAGGIAQLTGVFSNGVGGITPGNISAASGVAYNVTPAVTTIYTLTVTSSTETTATQTVTLTVAPVVPAPTITSFTADPTTILAGGSAQLTGVFTNGSGIITPGNDSATSGKGVTVTPTVTTTYTLTVTDSAGTAVTSVAQITVFPGELSVFAGVPGYSGNANGSGGNANFYNPQGIAVDGSGNVYVADLSNQTIRMITPGGSVSTLAGIPGVVGSTDSLAGTPTFNAPKGVAVDSFGNVYVADTFNSVIRKITSGGVVSTLAGLAGIAGSVNGLGPNARFYLPSGVAVDGPGNVYVADTDNHVIRMITSAGMVSTLAGTAGYAGSADGIGADARFHFPWGLAVDKSGNIYVADMGNDTIRKIIPSLQNGVTIWTVSTLAGTPGAGGSADGTGALASLDDPLSVTLDGSGNLYVPCSATIRMITPAGVVSTPVGIAANPPVLILGPLPASLYLANGAAIDPTTGDLFITCDDAILKVNF